MRYNSVQTHPRDFTISMLHVLRLPIPVNCHSEYLLLSNVNEPVSLSVWIIMCPIYHDISLLTSKNISNNVFCKQYLSFSCHIWQLCHSVSSLFHFVPRNYVSCHFHRMSFMGKKTIERSKSQANNWLLAKDHACVKWAGNDRSLVMQIVMPEAKQNETKW